jgi:acyl-coenzyme A thioesterase PaaI-like protein
VALFERNGASTFVPTEAATGPWSPDVLHGGAVSALVGGLLEHEEQVLVRVVIELLAPVPHAPLRAHLEPAEGGRRVMRQAVVLTSDDRPVARGSALRMRRADHQLPSTATGDPVVFDPAVAPELREPYERAARAIGWPSFDSLAVAGHVEPHDGAEPVRMWTRLLLPVVSDRPATPMEQTIAACDNATGINSRFDFRSWSFMNADLVVSVGRPPVGGWIGLESTGYFGATGTGQAVGTIHDAAGPLGQKSQSVLLDPRPPA